MRDEENSESKVGFRAVGRVKDAHGLKGELWVVLFAGQADWLDDMRVDAKFQLSPTEEIDAGALTEYPLRGARIHKNGLILQSASIKDRTAAEKLKGRFLAIPEAYLVGDEEYYLTEIEGFKVFDGDQEVGVIAGFSHNGAHDLLLVDLVEGVRLGVKEGDQISVPFVDDLVDDVNDEEQTVRMTLPEGIIEVQLGLDKAEVSDGDDEGPELEEFDPDETDSYETDPDAED